MCACGVPCGVNIQPLLPSFQPNFLEEYGAEDLLEEAKGNHQHNK
jgi:hypothetical protein